MSSILKALRKVEEEKSAEEGSSVVIARDILQRRYAAPSARSILLPSGLVLAALCAALGWWFWPQQPALLPVAAGPTLNRRLAPAAGQSVRPATTPGSVLHSIPHPASAQKLPVVIPDLQVTQIVFSRQPEARLAVINDLPVMEATDIAGVKVVEILSDRVRFSYRGVDFFKRVRNK